VALKWKENDPWTGHNLVLTPGGKQCAHIAQCVVSDIYPREYAVDMLGAEAIQFFDTLEEAKAFAEGVYVLEN
jgi:hypothetical protein